MLREDNSDALETALYVVRVRTLQEYETRV